MASTIVNFVVALQFLYLTSAELHTTVPNTTVSEFVTEDAAPFILNKPQNSDIIVGEDVKPGSNMLLTCTAEYPVQWVYTGDGRPSLSTNTSVKFAAHSASSDLKTNELDFKAYALISSPREKNTGNYTCRSLQDPRVAVSYFIYVPGQNIFTSPGGQVLQYSRKEPSLRIPCSVSHPRALVGLQKSVNGLLNCPLNESISYDPKTGFHLRTVDFPSPAGKYVCTAAYNGTVRYIEFNLTTTGNDEYVPYPVQEAPGFPAAADNDHCEKNVDCASDHVCDQVAKRCVDPCAEDLCGPSGGTCRVDDHVPSCGVTETQQNTTSGPSPSSCAGNPCGPLGVCRAGFGGAIHCYCKTGFVGTYPSCTRQQCKESRQCPNEYRCVSGYCHYVCEEGVCGKNASCRVVNQNPVCYCSAGMVGDPFEECRNSGTSFIKAVSAAAAGAVGGRSKCDSISCGLNAECLMGADGRAGCRCKPGYTGDSYTACYKEEQQTAAGTSCAMSPCGPNTVCKDVQNGSATCTCTPGMAGNPYIGCRPRGCSRHDDCNKNMMCINGKCGDPCAGPHHVCGANAICRTGQHNYRCSCAPGFSGDPTRQCYPNDEPIDEANNPCNPSPCGKNAECQPHRGRALCRCPHPTFGDPLVACHLKCSKTSECPNDQVCYSGNRTCANPCLIYDAGCGPGAECVVRNHLPNCQCPQGTRGDPYTRCAGKAHEEPAVPCYPLPCGDNAVCVIPQSTPSNSSPSARQQGVCSCIQGYVGDPYAGCQMGDKCSTDSDCSLSKGCVNGRCLNPCKFQGVCGINQDCFVRNHKPTCACRAGYPVSKNGNCYPAQPKLPAEDHPQQYPTQRPVHNTPSMPTHRPPSRPSTGHQSGSGGGSSCSVCGPYSECQVSQGVVACSCRAGMIGRPPNCRPECQYDGDCAYNKACIQYKCQDPCIGACGVRALCRVRQRTPVCSCPKGYYGSPLYECKYGGGFRTNVDDASVTSAAAEATPEDSLLLQDDYNNAADFGSSADTSSFFNLYNNQPQFLQLSAAAPPAEQYQYQHHQLPTFILPFSPFNHTGGFTFL